MKKVLLTAFVGSNNFGDEIVFRAVCQALDKLPDVRLSAFTMNKKRHQGLKKVRFIESKNPLTLVREIKKNDFMICGGGGLIQDLTTIWSPIRHTYKPIMASFLDKKFMFYGVGVNSLNDSFNKTLTRFIFNRAAAITVRDQKSKKVLENYGVKKPITATFDPVINLGIKPKPDGAKNLSFPYAVVILKHWFDINRFIPVTILKRVNYRSSANQQKYQAFCQAMAKFLDKVIEQHRLHLVFLPFFAGRDCQVHQDVIDLMKNRSACQKLGKQWDVHLVAGILKKAEALISMRFHGMLLASRVATPFFSLIYMEKMQSFLDAFDLSEYGASVYKLDPKSMSQKFTQLYRQRQKISRQIKKGLPMLQKQEKQNLTILKEIL